MSNDVIVLYFDVPITKLLLLQKIVSILYSKTIVRTGGSDGSGDDFIIDYQSIKNSIYTNLHYIKHIQNTRCLISNSPKKILIKRLNRYISQNIINFLISQNFIEISLEDYSITDQANFIYNADYVIGSHGAGLANIIFSNTHTKILELNNGFNSDCFIRFSKLCEGHYTRIMSDTFISKNTLFDLNINTFIQQYRNKLC